MNWRLQAIGIVATTALVTGGCDEKRAPPAPTTAPAITAPAPSPRPTATTPIIAAATGSIRGRANYTGAPATAAPLNRGSDPFCAKTPMNDESILVNANHTLQNVLVRISQGVPPNLALPAPPATAAVVDQSECMYRPRITTVVAGQRLVVTNGDPTFHNVHTYRGATTLFNIPQPMGAGPVEKVFRDDAALLRLGCDAHPWMKGYVFVSAHPWQAVTGTDGSFELKGVPAGTYTVEAWHEKLGTRSAPVAVAAGAAAELLFTWDGTEKGEGK